MEQAGAGMLGHVRSNDPMPLPMDLGLVGGSHPPVARNEGFERVGDRHHGISAEGSGGGCRGARWAPRAIAIRSNPHGTLECP
jgi:hypothetical protein